MFSVCCLCEQVHPEAPISAPFSTWPNRAGRWLRTPSSLEWCKFVVPPSHQTQLDRLAPFDREDQPRDYTSRMPDEPIIPQNKALWLWRSVRCGSRNHLMVSREAGNADRWPILGLRFLGAPSAMGEAVFLWQSRVLLGLRLTGLLRRWGSCITIEFLACISSAKKIRSLANRRIKFS